MTTIVKSKAHLLARRPKLPIEGLFCNYSHRVCMQKRLDGYEYCSKHILEDKNSPFKQCNYVSNQTGKRCQNAAPKSDKKDGYCPDHCRKATLMRQKAAQKRPQKNTPEALLEDLEHYSKTSGGATSSSNTVDPSNRVRSGIDGYASRILEYASSDDSEAEPILVDQAWRGDVDSEAESVDSEQEDLLKHSGIYTAEEVALITKDKLIRLQSLYIDQFKRLQHVLRERKRKFWTSYRQEKETLSSIHAAKDDPGQREKYKQLMGMKRYHKRFGKEALLHRQSKERRIAQSEGASYKPPLFPICMFTDQSTKCTKQSLPLTKYCMDHILLDPCQILYQSCTYGGNTACSKPVTAISDNPCCHLHTRLVDTEKRLPQTEIKDSLDMTTDAGEQILSLNEALEKDPIMSDQAPLDDHFQMELGLAPELSCLGDGNAMLSEDVG